MFSDGARLKMLTFPSENTYRWLAEIALGLQARSGRRLRLLNQRWLSLATKLSDGSRDELAGTFYAYLAANDAKNESLAAFHLERCLHIAGKRTSTFTDLLYLEASVFQAWFRRNPEKASAWRKLARGVHKLPWFILLRADTALLWSQGNVDQALSNCDEALTKVDTLPAEQREPFTRGWMEWKDEIVQRSQELQAVPATTV